MCAPDQGRSCNCFGSCGCGTSLTIEDEISLLEASGKRMQVRIAMTERRIAELKKNNQTSFPE